MQQNQPLFGHFTPMANIEKPEADNRKILSDPVLRLNKRDQPMLTFSIDASVRLKARNNKINCGQQIGKGNTDHGLQGKRKANSQLCAANMVAPNIPNALSPIAVHPKCQSTYRYGMLSDVPSRQSAGI